MFLCKLQILSLFGKAAETGNSLTSFESWMSMMIWPKLLVFLYVKLWMLSSYWSTRNSVVVSRVSIRCILNWLFFSFSISKLTSMLPRKVRSAYFSSFVFLTRMRWWQSTSSTRLAVMMDDAPMFPMSSFIAISLVLLWIDTIFSSPVMPSWNIVWSLLLKLG